MYADIATMSGKLGMKTRCVISLTGKVALRAVRHRPYASHGHATFDQTSNRQDVPRERR